MKIPLIVAATAALTVGPALAANGPRVALLDTLAAQAAIAARSTRRWTA